MIGICEEKYNLANKKCSDCYCDPALREADDF
jgi:hypothetical protein